MPIGAFVPPVKLKLIFDKSGNNTASAKIEAIDVAVNAQPLQYKAFTIGALNAVKEVQPLQYKTFTIGALNVVKEVHPLQLNSPLHNVFNSPIIGIPFKLIIVFAFS